MLPRLRRRPGWRCEPAGTEAAACRLAVLIIASFITNFLKISFTTILMDAERGLKVANNIKNYFQNLRFFLNTPQFTVSLAIRLPPFPAIVFPIGFFGDT
jgi:hypothetical protein